MVSAFPPETINEARRSIKEAEDNLKIAELQIKEMERAGIDVTDSRKLVIEAKSKARLFKNVFGSA